LGGSCQLRAIQKLGKLTASPTDTVSRMDGMALFAYNVAVKGYEWTALVLAWVGTGCWGICFWWMHRISGRQDTMLKELHEVMRRVEELSREEHQLIREVHPGVEEIKESVKHVADVVVENSQKER